MGAGLEWEFNMYRGKWEGALINKGKVLVNNTWQYVFIGYLYTFNLHINCILWFWLNTNGAG